MIRTTPFHERTSTLNEMHAWEHWSSYLAAVRYQASEKFEYFAIRNAAGLFDSSPLYKYRIAGRDAEAFLAGVLARDVRTCAPGQAQYTLWCDDRGFVIEDGVILRHAADEFLLTTAEPNLAYLRDLVGRERVSIEDVSEAFGVLAVQGPKAREILAPLRRWWRRSPTSASRRRPWEGSPSRSRAPGTRATWASRSGSTPATRFALGRGLGGRPGSRRDPHRDDRAVHGPHRGGAPAPRRRLRVQPLRVHRRPPLHADGAGPGLGGPGRADDRPGLHRPRRDPPRAAREVVPLANSGDRRRLARLGSRPRRGRPDPPKDQTPVHDEYDLYDDNGQQLGYATSEMYSPMLERQIALARVPLAMPAGERLKLEVPVNDRYV